MSLQITPACRAADLDLARRLMRRYAEHVNALGVDLCFQNFDDELAGLPGLYAPPAGGLWLAWHGGAAVGTIAVKPLAQDEACEMKRLWVEPAAQGLGLGRALAETAIAFARAAGYRRMRLDTLGERMPEAVRLYRRLGFVECAPYVHNPERDALFMERLLDDSRA